MLWALIRPYEIIIRDTMVVYNPKKEDLISFGGSSGVMFGGMVNILI